MLLVSCGREHAEDWPLKNWGKLVCEGGPLARTSCVWLSYGLALGPLWETAWRVCR